MKRPLWFLIVAMLVWACRLAPATTTAANLPRPWRAPAPVSGHVRVAEWARSMDMRVQWLRRDEVLEVVGGAHKIILTVNSCQASIDGVQVWLSFPVVSRGGAVYVASSDIRSTLEPIFGSPRNRSRSKVATVCLDPGHGGKDPGYRIGRSEEKKYTLLFAQEVRRQLTAAGLNVVLTRNGDRFVDLPLRPDFARRKGADIFVSLHFNSTEQSRGIVRGSEVYCITPAGAHSTNSRGQGNTEACRGNQFGDLSTSLAYRVQRSLVRFLGADRGVRRARFAVLRDATMPAILVEGGFLSHPSEGRKILEEKYRQGLARAVVEGILAYKKQVERD